MKFKSSLVFNILTSIDPLAGYAGRLYRYATSKSRNKKREFLMDLGSNLVPGGFAQSVVTGMVVDGTAKKAMNLPSRKKQTAKRPK